MEPFAAQGWSVLVSLCRCLRILRIVNHFRVAYTQLAWCSTLGGAHSALGDEFRSHVSHMTHHTSPPSLPSSAMPRIVAQTYFVCMRLSDM